MNKYLSGLLCCCCLGPSAAQTPLDVYVFEENKRGFLNQVKATIYELPANVVREEHRSDPDGHFSTRLPQGTYRIFLQKDGFFERNDTIEVGQEKVFCEVAMQRKPAPSLKLSEANNAVPLPDLKLSPFDKQADAPVFQVDKKEDKMPDLRVFPAEFTGYSIVIANTDRAFEPGKDSLLYQYPEIYLYRDIEGRFVYCIEQFAKRRDADRFLQEKARKIFPDARIQRFKNGLATD